ncbi:helix-turn-helix domain-containing protein [Sphingomonas sp. LT1P40]|uniref:helix-turn-helix domain-containing protein n=1 Tax=Alteristakelama amylovorans TaxID=3096166 RepID=UPI003FA6D4CB
MSNYSQLSIEERRSIARLREAGQSIRKIAAALDRQPACPSEAGIDHRPRVEAQQW